MKLCLFGGTFDPPHNAHFIIAEAIRESLDLSKIIFIPAFQPPHKYDKYPVTPVEHRIAMLKLCIDNIPQFEFSDIELKRGGVSYTIDTILEVKRDKGIGSNDLHFLIGSDSLAEFKSWHRWEEVLSESRVVVARRPRFEETDIDEDLLEQVTFLNLPRMEVSSSEIRERFYSDRMTRFYVPDVVSEYIKQNNIYGY
ncbi:MAG: nicotinate-nucleotide adenylyltransferase [Candidatus Marinimicrobia bacterium]|nr:nicotinate-nucleotide adenylyltransferase [Candidatus Neomarinimicrobiota bacterium]MCF7851005.1 nicotinate-nucleotide adenylyltransferase [Candidatus Neomarinimicrobiota bacterium]MCF7904941.1 nicotinate-nucleotide adenylyltransferase [Candidatus Neomarinimicrobiota bacterium]